MEIHQKSVIRLRERIQFRIAGPENAERNTEIVGDSRTTTFGPRSQQDATSPLFYSNRIGILIVTSKACIALTADFGNLFSHIAGRPQVIDETRSRVRQPSSGCEAMQETS
jgi:hypothetical protein